MASGSTSIRHLTQHSITLLIISLITLQRQLITCDDDRTHDTPSRLPESVLTSTPAAKAIELPQSGATSPNSGVKEACEVFAVCDKNYLTPVDVVVKNSDDNIACIKARFALSIKVEEAYTLSPQMANTDPTGANETVRSILGYLPLEHVISVEESCPVKKSDEKEDKKEAGKNEPPAKKTDEVAPPDKDELEMIVTFNCAKLAFTFKREDSHIFVSSIRGVVKLDQKLVREFVALGPMFVTSDLDHHFKYDDIIEVPSKVNGKTYVLTANFYYTEIEAFRKTTSRDFVQPPDEGSKPFSGEPYELPKQLPLDEAATKAEAQTLPSPPSQVIAE